MPGLHLLSCRFYGGFVSHIDLQQLHRASQLARAKFFHGCFTFLKRATA